MSAGICSLTVTPVITFLHGGSALGCPQTEVLILSKSVCVGVSSSMVARDQGENHMSPENGCGGK